jgi:hypothetical protein
MPPSYDSEYLNNSDTQLLMFPEDSIHAEIFVPSPWSQAIPYNSRTENITSNGFSKVGSSLSPFRMTSEADFALELL